MVDVKKISAEIQAIVPATALLIFAVSSSAALLITRDAGAAGRETVALFSPWSNQADRFDAIAETGAPIVGLGPVSWMIVAFPTKKSHSEALRAGAGFWLLNGRFNQFCRYWNAK